VRVTRAGGWLVARQRSSLGLGVGVSCEVFPLKFCKGILRGLSLTKLVSS
jgi:hypothetical protein